MNLRRMVRRLQAGLAQQGVRVRIQQFQHFREETNCFMTKYVVIREPDAKKTERETLMETYRLSEVVKALADLCGRGGENV